MRALDVFKFRCNFVDTYIGFIDNSALNVDAFRFFLKKNKTNHFEYIIK